MAIIHYHKRELFVVAGKNVSFKNGPVEVSDPVVLKWFEDNAASWGFIIENAKNVKETVAKEIKKAKPRTIKKSTKKSVNKYNKPIITGEGLTETEAIISKENGRIIEGEKDD
jgi:pyruvoyl-dependent arginine decarboxylase (PvlArgDC)